MSIGNYGIIGEKMKIANVVGARPNFMKIAPICRALDKVIDSDPSLNMDYLLVHSGQHYDNNMSKIFFDELGISSPDVNLEIGAGTHSEQTAGVMIKFEKFCLETHPDLILVVGDVNSTLACSLVGAKLGIKVAHIESGLRSFDRTMPEEINRIVTDTLSDYLFTSCSDAANNLLKEGIPENKIHFVGNVMIDTLFHSLARARVSSIRKNIGILDEDYALLTLHRPSNVDDPNLFNNIMERLNEISKMIRMIFVMHPRAKKQLERMPVFERIKESKRFLFIDATGYLDFINLMSHSKLVITDSGGVQEETTVLGIPCLTLRENTERPITITEGTNVLIGMDFDRLTKEVKNILSGNFKKHIVPELWDGKASERIALKLSELCR
ncbi:UDP-N-acetylglucosamine 2-epimerase [Candidatus Omnitrophus magneticus]|uniref:UDP-N-acetylglucosamine 2-epimerase n=1 Tax=Candidatus Omnitrophus magneticus TaxID=1609969 RepID=A0A0F0CQ66_9BACT|nr:UDP-N-acetylglucosamine 2-epimerase [Candidatus Omnitrophus magneticus]